MGRALDGISYRQKKTTRKSSFLYRIAMMGPIFGRNRHSDFSEIRLS